MCLICEKELSKETMKASRLTAHINKMYPERENNDLSFFQALRDKLKQKKSILLLMTKQEQQGYNIAKLISKSGKPYSIIYQLRLPVVEDVLRTVVHPRSPYTIIKSIPLCDDSVRRRIDEMVNILKKVCVPFSKNKRQSQAIDEVSVEGNEPLSFQLEHEVEDEYIYVNLGDILESGDDELSRPSDVF
ncbi:unnamed protein product [Lepeophtheirus salmonis]|uniref:(salmon louse) hypothetical protein n=1 Tax=Lepeophtheirus salmonis TaxID=72036 RepID=A0A7R8CS58_LEPSM|nr:unnamed protein product [Lepeophtheirus salmonis]CAF2913547.1 unnamed protein product [Lepeophtheirus salmonis]